jgi:repressor LexA
MALTRRQREVLEVIRSFITQHGYSPSLEEIGAALGLSSVATVHKHVSHLVDKGLVRRVWNQNRSIDLVDEAGHGNGSVPVPLMGTIAAGRPLEAVVARETLQVPADMVAGRKGVYGLRVRGDSMIEEQIRDGDLVLVEQRSEARDGETIVALVDGQDVTLKRLHREGPSVRLQPANPTMAPLILAADRVAVQGVVVGVIRRYA